MLTLLLGAITGIELITVVGYVLAACEGLIVLVHLVSFFVEPESKFGKFLAKVLKGLRASKEYATKVIEKLDDETEDKEKQ
jgi:hypothetical protein